MGKNIFIKRVLDFMSELLDDLLKSKDLNTIIKQNEKESLFLEYKGGDWLKNDEDGKFNLRKWVSSFANSAGGTLIIGVSEKTENNEILPGKIDGIDPSKFKEEIGKWIEDILKENIYPRLNPPPRISIFPTDSSKQRFVALIEIPQTNFYIHKVIIKGGKEEYFHRHNFQVLSMDEWEVRTLLFGRTPPPLLELSIEGVNVQGYSVGIINSYAIDIKIENIGWQMAKYLQLGIIRPKGNFSSELNPMHRAEYVVNNKNYLLNSLNNFFEVDDKTGVSVDTITFLNPNFLHPYDSIKIQYILSKNDGFPNYDLVHFGMYILAENLVRPEIYWIKILYLGTDWKPTYEFYPYEDQKIKILAHA